MYGYCLNSEFTLQFLFQEGNGQTALAILNHLLRIYQKLLERKEASHSNRVIFIFIFFKQWRYANFPASHRLPLRFQAKAVCDVCIPECTTNGRIKICSDKILSWHYHPGTDAKIITQKLHWVGNISGIEDMDCWSYNSYSVAWRWECCMGERQLDAWKKHCSTVSGKAKMTAEIVNYWQKTGFAIQIGALSEQQCWTLSHEQKWKP